MFQPFDAFSKQVAAVLEAHALRRRHRQRGVRGQARIHRAQDFTETYLKLEALVLDSLELLFGGRCALVTITQEMFRQSGSNETECDGIASLPRKIEGVSVGLTLREREDGSFKVSVRTYAPYDASAICAKMGGGGHARAAGCEIEADALKTGKDRLLDAVGTELETR